jgi:hypothetical protein
MIPLNYNLIMSILMMVYGIVLQYTGCESVGNIFMITGVGLLLYCLDELYTHYLTFTRTIMVQ